MQKLHVPVPYDRVMYKACNDLAFSLHVVAAGSELNDPVRDFPPSGATIVAIPRRWRGITRAHRYYDRLRHVLKCFANGVPHHGVITAVAPGLHPTVPAHTRHNGPDPWTANVRLVVEGERLRWTSQRGSQSYVRCGQKVLTAGT
jgi:hypothetical protein